MHKFTCPFCGEHEVIEVTFCEGMVVPISLENESPEYQENSVFPFGDIDNISFHCANCGEVLTLQNGDTVCCLEDLDLYLKEHENDEVVEIKIEDENEDEKQLNLF